MKIILFLFFLSCYYMVYAQGISIPKDTDLRQPWAGDIWMVADTIYFVADNGRIVAINKKDGGTVPLDKYGYPPHLSLITIDTSKFNIICGKSAAGPHKNCEHTKNLESLRGDLLSPLRMDSINTYNKSL
jgi:hypothetical protein